MEQKKKDHVVALNRKARHDYFVVDTFECGVVLAGTEIKSVRAGKVNLKDGYAKFERGELWLMNVHISPYEKASWYQHDPRQNRKLLLHKSELRRLSAKVKEKGFTLVPLSMYLKEGRLAKVALALVQGKNAHDRRDAIIERDAKRAIARELRNRGKDY
ncbi:SsrA-binding protein SmpB [Pyramidobacter piscolens]|uniref:SsrA-binding protein SmpB n=1 Tax=Pyramidobacter piscolens TaxID=638849 RepID=UPI001FCC0612|nr:SsrA-binding protein SmpB [Pyramidobacter piscolens]BDF78996.1 SsrA-binding protein [Pyramidobacter piscolens]